MSRPLHLCVRMILLSVLTAVPGAATATMYECADAGGGRVFTDSPAQLKNCMPLGGTKQVAPVAAPSVSMAPSSPMGPPESGPSVDIDKPPSYFPGAMVPPPGISPASDRDNGIAPMHDPLAAATTEQASSSRCVSPVNPFNPMMTIPCPPSANPAQPAPGPEGPTLPSTVSPEATTPALPEVLPPAP